MHACFVLIVLYCQTRAPDPLPYSAAWMQKHEGGFSGAIVVPGSCPQQINIPAGHWDQLPFWSQQVCGASNYFLFAWLSCAMVSAGSSSLTAQLHVTNKPVLEAVGISQSGPALPSPPPLAAQSLPTFPLPSSVPYSTVSWFNDSAPQKLLLSLWGYCSQGLASRAASQRGQSTVASLRETVGGDGKREHAFFSTGVVAVCLALHHERSSQKSQNLPGLRVNISIPTTLLWSSLNIVLWKTILKKNKMVLFLCFQLRHSFLRNKTHY